MMKNKEHIQICRKLRWKGSQQVRKNPELLRMTLMKNEVQYSCLQTFEAWGPDGSLAAPEKCGCSRSCFKSAPDLLSALKNSSAPT